jgi:hypothetical protein
MLEKIIMLLLLCLAIWAGDGAHVKKANRRERYAYGAVFLVVVYFSIDYVMEANWPNPNDVIRFFLQEPAKWIVKSIEVPPS